jgi:hypothetical protein
MKEEQCTIGILDLMACLFWVMDFLGAAATQCGYHVIPEAGCAAEVSGIVANFIEIGRYAIDINRTCVPIYAEMFNAAAENIDSTQQIPECLMDVQLEGGYLERITTDILSLFQECQSKTPRACWVDIVDLISQFSFAADFLTAAIIDCSPKVIFDVAGAVCAEAISNTIAEISALLAETAVIDGCSLHTAPETAQMPVHNMDLGPSAGFDDISDPETNAPPAVPSGSNYADPETNAPPPGPAYPLGLGHIFGAR